ncbi:hypothetical protein [Streptomyces sp. NPDC050504]|uniref:hypothetical protein n=1 Tax=Streptomyces sp. NPDC050504 TaxID=3365618 RepID=UPI0037ABCB8E
MTRKKKTLVALVLAGAVAVAVAMTQSAAADSHQPAPPRDSAVTGGTGVQAGPPADGHRP